MNPDFPRSAAILALCSFPVALLAASPSPAALAECRLHPVAAWQQAGKLKKISEKYDEDEYGSATIHVFDPAGIIPFGFSAQAFSALDYTADTSTGIQYETLVQGSFEEVRAAALQSHGSTACLLDTPDRCVVSSTTTAPPPATLQVAVERRPGGQSALSCDYSR